MVKAPQFAIAHEGTDVIIRHLRTGGEWRMNYQTGLRVAALLFHEAKQAKAEAGDESRQWIGLGTLTDANMDELKAQKRRDATVLR
jgi:hypothetical protein